MNFVRQVLIASALFATTCLGAPDDAKRPNLRGTVVDESGKPVEGATAYIWTAAVKQGYSTFCPSCYADCGKRAKSNEKGEFEVSSLDPDLRFEILTVKDGFTPTFNRKVDPVATDSLSVTLPSRVIPTDSAYAIRGTIVDPSGKPIAGAYAQIEMVMYTDENGKPGGRGGRVEGLDPIAITNDAGEFTLVYSKYPITSCDLDVGARGFASRRLNGIAADQFPIEVMLREGGMIRGTLVRDGVPVPNAEMILTCFNREMSRWLGEWKIGTNEKGEFLFSNIPIYEDGPSRWWLAASMKSIRNIGATTPITVEVARNGQDIVAPTIEVKKGYKATGRFVMPDGLPVPEGSRAFLSSTTSWDDQHVMLDSTGQFEFTGLWNGEFEIHPSIKGYQVVGRAIGQWSGPDVHIDNADVANLQLPLEPTTPRSPQKPN